MSQHHNAARLVAHWQADRGTIPMASTTSQEGATLSYQEPRMRQLVDWSAAFQAGFLAGLAFLLVNLFVIPAVIGGNAWIMIRLAASVLLGDTILAPPATFDLSALAAGLLVHFTLSVLFALFIAFCLHRWGIVVGIVGGALFGLALYGINFYTLTMPDLYPWFYPFRGVPMALSHVLFGALAGGIYEALEVEEFVPVEES